MKEYKLNAKGLACPLPVVQTKKLLQEYETVETTVDNVIATENLEKLAKQLNLAYNITTISEDEYVVTIGNLTTNHTVIDTLSDCCVVPVTQARRVLENESKVEIFVKELASVESLEKFASQNNYSLTKNNQDDFYSVVIEKSVEDKKEENVSIKDESYIVVINKKIMGHGSEELGARLMKAYLYALTEQEVLPKKIIFYNDGGVLVDKNKSNVLPELKELESNGVEIVCCGACIDYHNIDLAVGNPTNMYFIVEDMRKANRIIRP